MTTDAWQNRSVFQVVEIADTVIQRLFKCRDQGAYLLHEFVLMPNRLHLLLTPDRGATLEKAMQLIKGGSSHEIHARRGHRMLVWQPGFHDCTIRDATDFQARREYIRTNPVEAGLVERAEDWPYGSASGKFRLDPMPERLGFRG